MGRAGGTGSYCNGANHIASVHALRSHQTLHLCSLPAPASDGQETKFPRGSARSFPKQCCTLFSLQTLEKAGAGSWEHYGGFQVGEERMQSCRVACFRGLTEDIC